MRAPRWAMGWVCKIFFPPKNVPTISFTHLPPASSRTLYERNRSLMLPLRQKNKLKKTPYPEHNMCNPNMNASERTEAAPPPPPTNLYRSLVSIPDAAVGACECPKSTACVDPRPTHQPSHLQYYYKEIFSEAKCLIHLGFPIGIAGLLLYARSIVSMLFLGSVGELELAAGSLAIAFANITGYSVLSGLALGMEPLCAQAYGARRPKLLSLTLHRGILFLLSSSLPISLLWTHVSAILVFMRQDPEIAGLAQKYLLFCLPDLATFSLIHPIRIYLRTQGITLPITISSLAAAAFHVPANLLLVTRLRLGMPGVAAASAASNCFVLLFLLSYLFIARPGTFSAPSSGGLSGWKPLLRLSAASCVSVCLEWWWYEIIILLCGLLPDPRSAVAAMGILIQTTALIYVFPSSLGYAVSTRVGNELGAGRADRAGLSAVVAVSGAAAMGLAASGFAMCLRGRWGRLFTADAGILSLTSAALPILGLCELGNCPQTVGCGVLRGSARPAAAANVNLGAFYGVGMPCAVGLAFLLGVGFTGLWVGLLAAQVCCAGLMLYVVGTTDWDAQCKRARSLTSSTPALDCPSDVEAGENREHLIPIKVEH